MILVDTSVWIEHLRHGVARLGERLENREVATHPFVIGELALGGLRDRSRFLACLRDLPEAIVATNEEALRLIESRRLHGRGIGFVDVHLLASALLSPGTELWSLDRSLAGIAGEIGVGERLQ